MKISKETKKAIGWMVFGGSILAAILLAYTGDYALQELKEISSIDRDAIKNIVAMMGCYDLVLWIGLGWITAGLCGFRNNLVTMNREIEDLKLGLNEALSRIRELEEKHAQEVEKCENNRA